MLPRKREEKLYSSIGPCRRAVPAAPEPLTKMPDFQYSLNGESVGGVMNKSFAAERPYADPQKAARKITEIASGIEAVQDGRIYIEKINGAFLFQQRGSPAEYRAALHEAIALGWFEMHESGTYVRLTEAGIKLFA